MSVKKSVKKSVKAGKKAAWVVGFTAVAMAAGPIVKVLVNEND